MKNQLRGTISAYLLAAVVPLGAYAEQEDYFNQSSHDSEDPYLLFCADRPLIFTIPRCGVCTRDRIRALGAMLFCLARRCRGVLISVAARYERLRSERIRKVITPSHSLVG